MPLHGAYTTPKDSHDPEGLDRGPEALRHEDVPQPLRPRPSSFLLECLHYIYIYMI